VHGDLTGNVLFAEELAPAIIDFSPFWRPPAYASAIVVADAFVWDGADESLIDAVAHIPHFPQFLVRALIMRAVVIDSSKKTSQPEPTIPTRSSRLRMSPAPFSGLSRDGPAYGRPRVRGGSPG
jgi:hypothetical protein